jgi:hypothetical protein
MFTRDEKDFTPGMVPPATINVEVTAETARRRYTSVYEYRRPQPLPMHSTP